MSTCFDESLNDTLDSDNLENFKKTIFIHLENESVVVDDNNVKKQNIQCCKHDITESFGSNSEQSNV